MKMHKRLWIRWLRHVSVVDLYKRTPGFVICDSDFHIKVVSHKPLLDTENLGLVLHGGDLIVLGRVHDVYVIKVQDNIIKTTIRDIRFSPSTETIDNRRIRCGVFECKNLKFVPQEWAEVIKQTIVLSKILTALIKLTVFMDFSMTSSVTKISVFKPLSRP